MSARDRAWGRWYAKRGARRVITRSDAVQTNAQRIADWASRYYLVPVEMRIGRAQPAMIVNREDGG